MNRLNKWLGVALLASVMALPAQANLVNNGDFEVGTFSGWGMDAAGAGSNFAVGGTPVHGGNFAAHFSANQGQHDVIHQNIGTTVGKMYNVSFWVHNFGAGNDSLQVLWEGNTILDLTPVGTELESWTPFSIDVMATQDAFSELRFRAHDGNAMVSLDDISVTASPVPEPATMAIMGSGLLLVLRRRRAR